MGLVSVAAKIGGDEVKSRSILRKVLLVTGIAVSITLFMAGCNNPQSTSSGGSNNGMTKVKVGYIGLTCEAPLFAAVEKGFFKEEKLDVTMVKCEWAQYKDVLALGGFDITHHLIMYFLKPIE